MHTKFVYLRALEKLCARENVLNVKGTLMHIYIPRIFESLTYHDHDGEADESAKHNNTLSYEIGIINI